ncbi:hypothetical protein ACVIJ6_000131 [Bradyrhizobium sp. USDA 4369]
MGGRFVCHRRLLHGPSRPIGDKTQTREIRGANRIEIALSTLEIAGLPPLSIERHAIISERRTGNSSGGDGPRARGPE